MRKTAIAAIMASTALFLSACADETAEPTAEATAPAATEPETDTAMSADGAVLDANSATVEELVSAGLTSELANAVVSGRPYDSVVDLNTAMLAAGSEAQATEALTTVFVPVNLNSATREQIALIPGMTDRMIGEFLEYRPYEDMAEFDREIGKYVDETEVARFRNYVTL